MFSFCAVLVRFEVEMSLVVSVLVSTLVVDELERERGHKKKKADPACLSDN